MPSKVRGLVQEWAEIHQKELLEMWKSKQFYERENPIPLLSVPLSPQTHLNAKPV